MPGAGKTVLSSLVVETLKTRFHKDEESKVFSQDEVGIAYHYFDFQRQDEQGADILLRSLLKQLLQRRPSLLSVVKPLYDEHRDKPSRPSLHEISKILQSVVVRYSKVYIIVDALDECQAKTGNSLQETMSVLFRLQKETDANLFATSRFIPEITERFKESFNVEIRADEQDVRRYLDERALESLPPFVAEDRKLLDDIKTKIVKAVDGMYVPLTSSSHNTYFIRRFLLARLYLDSLEGRSSPKAIRIALADLPTGSEAYDYLYQKAMERIERQPKASQQLAKQVLAWIACAKRPLSKFELEHALAVEIDQPQFDEDNICRVDMVSPCAGLVTVDESSGITQLVHYTTQEYLLQNLPKWFPKAHEHVAMTCITYLCYDVFETGFCTRDEDFEERLRSNPFYDYAARNWGHHARNVRDEVKMQALEFLGDENKISASAQAAMVLKGSLDYSQRVPRNIGALHLAAYFGLVTVVSELLQNGHDSSCVDTYGQTPLALAAANGHDKVVSFLRERPGVDLNCKDQYGRTPLSLAAEKGYETVVKELLKAHGVKIDSKDVYGQTPLLWATVNSHHRVVRMLTALNHGNSTRNGNFQNSSHLLSAAKNGNEWAVEVLLENIPCDPKDEDNRTPLSWAAEKGHTAVVVLLLNKDADVNTHDKSGTTPLVFAVMNGRKDVIELLLEYGGRLNSRDDLGRTPLWHAANLGRTDVVQLLLSKSNIAEANYKDSHGFTPLLCAADRGHIRVVEQFLDRGARVELDDNSSKPSEQYAVDIVNLLAVDKASANRRVGHSQELLLRAAGKGHVDVAEYLLKMGIGQNLTICNSMAPDSYAEGVVLLLLDVCNVDEELRGEQGRTLLSCAAERGHKAVVQLLLGKVAHTDRKSNSGHTPLSYAAKGGHEAIVQQLLNKGANPDTVDNDDRTPLSWAAKGGHKAVVKMLLDNGANPDAADTDCRTPLSWAFERWHDALVRQRFDKGSALNPMDKDVRVPISWASERAYEAIVQLLVSNSVNLDAINKDGRTPLSWASEGGNVAIVQQLLDNGAVPNRMDNNHRMPISWAAERGHKAVVQLLLGRVAHTDQKSNSGHTPLSYAAKGGHEAVVQQLLCGGANPEVVDNDDRTPLSWAAERGHKAVVKLLLDNGANHVMDNDDRTPRTIESGMLLGMDHYTNRKSNSGHTPLSYAAKGGHEAIVQQLLNKGANPDAADNDDRTPLSWAVEKGHRAVVKLLLDIGADIEADEMGGGTPLARAIENGSEDIIRTLLEKRAKVDYTYLRCEVMPRAEAGLLTQDLFNGVGGDGIKWFAKLAWGAFYLEWRHLEVGFRIMIMLLGLTGFAAVLVGFTLIIIDHNLGYLACFIIGGVILTFFARIFGGIYVLFTIIRRRRWRPYRRSPLSRAVEKGDCVSVGLLLKYGAQPNFDDGLSDTPLRLAKRNNNKDIVQMLESGSRSSESLQLEANPM
ncbi:hypothetical protein EIK77_003939 [Talaromyces pinophilus]|nr:hypothetical protein EIK77_003939 [Talaromyces pinophilus]